VGCARGRQLLRLCSMRTVQLGGERAQSRREIPIQPPRLAIGGLRDSASLTRFQRLKPDAHLHERWRPSARAPGPRRPEQRAVEIGHFLFKLGLIGGDEKEKLRMPAFGFPGMFVKFRCVCATKRRF